MACSGGFSAPQHKPGTSRQHGTMEPTCYWPKPETMVTRGQESNLMYSEKRWSGALETCTSLINQIKRECSTSSHSYRRRGHVYKQLCREKRCWLRVAMSLRQCQSVSIYTNSLQYITTVLGWPWCHIRPHLFLDMHTWYAFSSFLLTLCKTFICI